MSPRTDFLLRHLGPAAMVAALRAGLWGSIAASAAFGMVSVARGAHFLWHDLWSALVCWLVVLGLYLAVLGIPESAP